VPEREHEPVAQLGADLVDDGRRGPAVRALVVAVLEQGELGSDETLEVVVGADAGIE
jgi:hypothetical protein